MEENQLSERKLRTTMELHNSFTFQKEEWWNLQSISNKDAEAISKSWYITALLSVKVFNAKLTIRGYDEVWYIIYGKFLFLFKHSFFDFLSPRSKKLRYVVSTN